MWGVGGGFRPPRASISVPQNFLVLKGVELCQKAFRGYQKHVFKAFLKAVGFFYLGNILIDFFLIFEIFSIVEILSF